MKYITKSYKKTQKLGEKLAQKILKNSIKNSAIVLLLYGDLGGGKTTFLQGFAKGLSVKEKILSPTFVILKHFKITSYKLQVTSYKNFYHIDCYRLQNEKDAKELGLPEILKNPENIVAIEWPERIKKIFTRQSLGKNRPIKVNFKFISKNERSIDIK